MPTFFHVLSRKKRVTLLLKFYSDAITTLVLVKTTITQILEM